MKAGTEMHTLHPAEITGFFFRGFPVLRRKIGVLVLALFRGFICSFCFVLFPLFCQINSPKMNCKSPCFHAAYENKSSHGLVTVTYKSRIAFNK